MHYRIYVLDRLGSFVDVVDELCDGDAEALMAAEARCGNVPAVQVWQQGRFVGKIEGRRPA